MLSTGSVGIISDVAVGSTIGAGVIVGWATGGGTGVAGDGVAGWQPASPGASRTIQTMGIIRGIWRLLLTFSTNPASLPILTLT